jgi:hypothetical protein
MSRNENILLIDSGESVNDTNPVAGFLVLGSDFDCVCLLEETMETTVRAMFMMTGNALKIQKISGNTPCEEMHIQSGTIRGYIKRITYPCVTPTSPPEEVEAYY